MEANGVKVCRMLDVEWSPVGNGAVKQKIVRIDESTGEALGLVSMSPLTRTGLHKHLDITFAYHLSGSSSNNSAVVRAGQLGITLKGTVHETVYYEQAVTVGRTEGLTMYPNSTGQAHIHAGVVHGDMRVEEPEQCGCFCIIPESLPLMPTAVAGVSRRILFDYLPTGKNRRLAEFRALPGITTPAHRTTNRIEFFVLTGDLSINELRANATDFVLVDPGINLTWGTCFGCRLLVWADGPAPWVDPNATRDFYGFSN